VEIVELCSNLIICTDFSGTVFFKFILLFGNISVIFLQVSR
jgi:hypothetical protein